MSAVVTLKKGEGRMVKSGGMWIFDNEIESVMGTFENGDLVLVHDFDGYPIGIGFINHNSKIRVRLFSRKEDTVIDEAFFRPPAAKPHNAIIIPPTRNWYPLSMTGFSDLEYRFNNTEENAYATVDRKINPSPVTLI